MAGDVMARDDAGCSSRSVKSTVKSVAIARNGVVIPYHSRLHLIVSAVSRSIRHPKVRLLAEKPVATPTHHHQRFSMLRRFVVAGPSRALLARQLSTATQGAESTAQPASTVSSTPSPDHTGVPQATLQRLIDIASRPAGTQSRQDRFEAWRIYSNLAPVDRSRLSSNELRAILRVMAPRYDEAWGMATRESDIPKQRIKQHTARMRQGHKIENSLQAVMEELMVRNENNLNDWLFVLNALGRLGRVSTIEAILSKAPEEIRDNRRVLEARLGAITNWSRSLSSAFRKPRLESIQIAHDTFWDVFQRISSHNQDLNGFTLRLLLTSISSVSKLVATSGQQEEGLERLDGLFRYILAQAYGLDLDNLAVSVQARDAGDATRTGLAKLSAKGLTAVMTQLAAVKTDPYRMIATYELLTKMPRAAYTQEEIYEQEEEDDDYYVTPDVQAEEPITEAEASLASEASSSYQGFRTMDQFFPPSTKPAAVSALPAKEAARLSVCKPIFSHETITVLLTDFRERGVDRALFRHVLRSAIADAQDARARWLAVYLGCPDSRRPRLRKSIRLSPEWFKQALERDDLELGKGSGQTALLIQRVLDWNTEELGVIFNKEKEIRGCDDLESLLEYPPWAKDPRIRRIKRNLEVCIIPEELKTIASDTRTLKGLLERAQAMAGQRSESRARQARNRSIREAEAEAERLREEAEQQEAQS